MKFAVATKLLIELSFLSLLKHKKITIGKAIRFKTTIKN